jgi:hypothetical protein
MNGPHEGTGLIQSALAKELWRCASFADALVQTD